MILAIPKILCATLLASLLWSVPSQADEAVLARLAFWIVMRSSELWYQAGQGAAKSKRMNC